MTRTTPIPAIIPDAVQTALAEPPACAAAPGSWCARFYQWTNNESLASAADAVVTPTLRIVLILVIALGVRHLLHRSITRLVAGATNGHVTKLLGRAPKRLRAGANPLVTARRAQRARTIGSVLRSITSAVVLLIAAVMILAEFGVALGPILASAGIVGVAVGFGAQNLVRDFLSGMFMLLEDQYGVGDIVDLGEASGVVEAVGLRITTVRDHQGTVWYVRNGEILRVGNKSQGYAVAVVDLPLAHTADMTQAAELAGRIAASRVEGEDIKDDVLEPPEVLGVEKVTAEGVTLRLTVKVNPGRQFAVQRALNAAITDEFDEHDMPRPGPFATRGAADGAVPS
ncbi:MAG: MscS Mechanosensitive ion channel [Pseudonocardia sp.]|jgi:small conductance mechanosensitive channel|uniref:mechanosensitive ion channel family protein n=1 Tax=Pseudonocardia sp. TaxID=60912 RepID=UPI002613156B|nr:mechanosensitive ion channel family protein [Pseudonocardia sp.]MCU1627856.1 MscS Mechanosensitive ion channel [Pseudonocardia sp.]MDT7699195.1 moderate conductance mechanosensitive channel [Pseudonocardiales bacterium]HEV7470051.1 mechanosensitive ion channel family protein [Pseudonocardia sp.]